MSIFWDGLISIISFYFYFLLKKRQFHASRSFQTFFFWMGSATFFGVIGHVFFYYLGVFGKYPSWLSTIITAYYFCISVLEVTKNAYLSNWKKGLLIKGMVLLCLSYYIKSFTYIAIDSVFSFVLIGTYFGLKFKKKTNNYYLLVGSMLIYPTIFIFGLKLTIHPLFNKDDFSHLFILISLFFYYFCTTKIKDYDV